MKRGRQSVMILGICYCYEPANPLLITIIKPVKQMKLMKQEPKELISHMSR